MLFIIVCIIIIIIINYKAYAPWPVPSFRKTSSHLVCGHEKPFSALIKRCAIRVRNTAFCKSSAVPFAMILPPFRPLKEIALFFLIRSLSDSLSKGQPLNKKDTYALFFQKHRCIFKWHFWFLLLFIKFEILCLLVQWNLLSKKIHIVHS